MLDVMKRAKDLSSEFEESSSKVKSHTQEVEVLKKSQRHVGTREDQVLAIGDVDNKKYKEVMRELELVRQELSMLKLDMASILEEKSLSEKQTEVSNAKTLFYTSSVEEIRDEIEEATEEQVLAELAQIEAAKEFGDIEAEREREANQFSSAVDKTRKKMEDIVKQVDYSKDLETKLAVTMSDVHVLQNKLKVVKEMDKRIQRIDSLSRLEPSFWKEEDLEGSELLQSVTEELEAARTELAAVKEEGFQYMASMDVIRNEHKHLTNKTAWLRKTEEKSNSRLKVEAEAAKKEKELVCEETASIKSEILKMELEIESTEEKLQATMQELETVKSSEAVALENLKTLIENTVRARAFESQSSSSITISKFEHEYLTGRAVAAEGIADKKVAAAQAWVEALRANLKKMRVDEEQGEEQNWGQKRERIVVSGNWKQAIKAMKSNGYQTPYRRARYRKSASPRARNNFPIQKKKKVMPNLPKLFSGKKTAKDE
ncbi:unnamed protein product [Malus baccata var. baccata]